MNGCDPSVIGYQRIKKYKSSFYKAKRVKPENYLEIHGDALVLEHTNFATGNCFSQDIFFDFKAQHDCQDESLRQ